MRPQFQKSLRCYVVVVATVTLRLGKQKPLSFYFYILLSLVVNNGDGSYGKWFVCLFVCLFFLRYRERTA